MYTRIKLMENSNSVILCRNDEIRSLVYGQVESLHFTLSELSKERNQVKETAEVFIQTDIVSISFILSCSPLAKDESPIVSFYSNFASFST